MAARYGPPAPPWTNAFAVALHQRGNKGLTCLTVLHPVFFLPKEVRLGVCNAGKESTANGP